MKQCRLCDAGHIAELADADGTLCRISGNPGTMKHLSDDMWAECPRLNALFVAGIEREDVESVRCENVARFIHDVFGVGTKGEMK